MVVCLVALAVFILLSGLDDLFIALVLLFGPRDQVPWPSDAELEAAPERPIAVFVPLWLEHRVIGQMLERNLSVLSYENYHVFVGIYANDLLTQRAVADIAARYKNVTIARVGHDGPTSKGDCLNWIHRAMETYERRHNIRFEVVVTHDAEDLMHPVSLRLINWFSKSYDMVQIPVLPLATGAEWTHGLYCDEFAEYQSKDIPVRQRLGGFLPSNGVGVGFSRSALERLAAGRGGSVFDPESLTEDYESGFRLHRMGCRQMFVPIRFDRAGPIATREYFPRSFRQAVRQRSRWVAGISLQSWQRYGWRAPWKQVYWFWRDRKGLVGSLVSPAANLLFLYGLAGGLQAQSGQWVEWVCAATVALSAFNLAMRVHFAARIYGWRFAAGVPLRAAWGNLVNCAATAAAIQQYLRARIRRRTLVWRKTDHVYPSADSRHGQLRIGEVLVSRRWLSTADLESALAGQPAGLRLGEYLIHLQKLTEENLYQALSVQTGIPLGLPNHSKVNPLVTRSLPAATVRRWKVMPFRVVVGQLHVLTSDIPSPEMAREIASFSRLEIRFRLVMPKEIKRLTTKYLACV